jgi:putative ABC transport system permease protein
MKIKILPKERPLAWAQLSHQKVRTGVAMGGIAFANVLIFMQLGFLNLFASGAILLPMHLKGDLFLMNPDAKFIGSAATIDLTRLYQSAAFDGIVAAEPLYVYSGTWAYDRETISYDTRVYAYNPRIEIFDIPEINQQQSKLREPFTVLFDRLSRSQLGPIPAQMATKGSTSAMFNNQRLVVTGLYNLGSSFFLSSGNIITSDFTCAEIFGSSLKQVALGILRVKPGTDLIALKHGIEQNVPGIQVLTHQELIAKELKFQDTYPTSTIFNFGAVMGFIVGVAIVYQVLYSDVSDHLSEYATLKAIGYSNRSLLLVILQEALFLAILGYIPGFIASLGMYQVLTNLTRLELIMNINLALTVFILTLAMCLLSAAIASNKLHAADPADVFS